MTSEDLTAGRLSRLLPTFPGSWKVSALARFGLVLGVSALLFALILLLDRHNPLEAFRLLYEGSIGSTYGRNEILVKLVPFVLCAVATAVPARVGLINVGGEGQLHLGAWAATAVILFSGAPSPLLLPLAILAGAMGGAVWAGIPALLKVWANLNEAISTLLLNYVAVLLVNYVVYGPWRDKATFNWPFTAVFPGAATLPVVFGNRVHAGIFFVPLVLLVMSLVLSFTRFGFEMRAVGGNALAAERSGIAIKRYLFWALIAGGAVAGLAGMAEVCGIQGRLRPGISVHYGFIGFLASWLGGHRPGGVLLASLLFSAIAVGGDSLQIGADLPASTVNIFMALILFAVLASRRYRSEAGG